MTKPKRPKPYRSTGYGILNPYGDMWTPEMFETKAEATSHLERFWSQPGFGPNDLSRFKIVKAKQVVHYVGDAD
ncbi:hypothetical protein ABIA95_000140 [Bradyrhizobium sp. LA8.1]|uniref:hypothetical protein n=1 Tax=unclassified Bradyrhizobium TaxID=2631580 RepID=UPI003394EB65